MSSVNYRDLRPLYIQAFLIDNLTFCFNIADTKLLWLHGKSNDKSVSVSGSARMDGSVKCPDNDDISFCYDSGAQFNST